MKKRKINPRRIPATKADIEKAKKRGTEEAVRRAISLMLYVLIDKHGTTMEEIQRMAKELNYCADSVSKGYIKWRDIERVVFEEYGVELPW